MRKTSLFFALIICISTTYAQKSIWAGDLRFTKNQSLKLVLVIDNQQDTIVATLDSPDQYVTDLPTRDFSIKDDTVRFEEPTGKSRFVGVMSGDSIAGKFSQHGHTWPLTLRRTTERKLFPRPQTPTPPFPYICENLSFTDRYTNTAINGTLTRPQGQKPKAVAILISGSGWQDRDESIYGHKPFAVIADTLTRAGFAVFRYDDADLRIANSLHTGDFANQVRVLIDSLPQLPDLQGVPIGLVGHSEGGLIAFMVAAQEKRVDFVISLAGVGIHMKEILLSQVMQLAVKEQMKPDILPTYLQLNNEFYTILEKAKNADDAKKKLAAFFDKNTAGMSESDLEKYHFTPMERMQKIQAATLPWFLYIMKIQPEKFIKKISCPVLALNGSKDIQVSAVENISAIKKLLKPNSLHQCTILPDLNHLFQECETGFPDEYGEIEQTISPAALKAMTEWLERACRSL